jgi:hypothetical protein
MEQEMARHFSQEVPGLNSKLVLGVGITLVLRALLYVLAPIPF